MIVFVCFAAVGPNGVISGDKKIPKECFVKHCDQRRKYPVLYKLEFQVIVLLLPYCKIVWKTSLAGCYIFSDKHDVAQLTLYRRRSKSVMWENNSISFENSNRRWTQSDISVWRPFALDHTFLRKITISFFIDND